MPAIVLYGWWKQSCFAREGTFEDYCAGLGPTAPVLRPRWFLQRTHRYVAQRPGDPEDNPGKGRLLLRAAADPLGLASGATSRSACKVCSAPNLVTGLGCLVMWLSWEFGWLNSFKQGV